MRAFLASTLLLSLLSSPLQAHRLEIRSLEFEVAGHRAFILEADSPAPGKPWVWYAPTLKRHPDPSHTWYFKRLLAKGVSVAGCDVGEVRGSPRSIQDFNRFHDEMIKRGYSDKPVLLGQSRGGLMMLSWAVNNPGKVSAFAGIYPVCNLESWPLVRDQKSTLKDYGMDLEELRASLKRFNPTENLAALAEHEVPMFMVHGDSDGVVPLKDNSALIEDRYSKLDGPVTVKVIPGKGHAVVDEFFKCGEMIAFLLASALAE